MSRILKPLALLLPVLLAGCGDGGAARRAFLASLVGQSETDLVRQLGVPTRSFESGGRKFLAYDQERLEVIPAGPFFGGFGYGGFGRGGFGYGLYGAFPPTVVERGCETTFELGAGRVLGWSLRGNACG